MGQFQSEKELFWKVHGDWKGLSEVETQKLWDAKCKKENEAFAKGENKP